MARLKVGQAKESKIEKYSAVLYGLNFMEEVLEIKPEECLVTDESELWHFGVNPETLRHKLFYKYGYMMPEEKPTTAKLNEDDKQIVTGVKKSKKTTKLWQVLAAIEKNLKTTRPDDVYSFWAIPSRFCVSHIHPARDVFKAQYLPEFIGGCDFDILIEILPKERDKKYSDTVKIPKSIELHYTYVMPEECDIDLNDIESIIAKIDKFIAKGKRILFHSQGRTDRLGLVLACWMIKHKLADSSNFIDKIEALREGFCALGEDKDKVLPYRDLNRFLDFNCDETRLDLATGHRTGKIRVNDVVPFLFTRAQREVIPYWTRNLNLQLDYRVDEDVAEILKHFEVGE